jgi:hypothetical protein
VLENLEAEFYQQAIAKFNQSDFTAAGFQSAQLVQQQLNAIQRDEATHAAFLEVSTFRRLDIVWWLLSCFVLERPCVVRSATDCPQLHVQLRG